MKALLLAISILIVSLVSAQSRINESRQTNAPMYLKEYNRSTKKVVTYKSDQNDEYISTPQERKGKKNKIDTIIQLVTPAGKKGDSIIYEVPSGSRFTIVEETTTDFVIYFWDWGETDENYYSLNYKGEKGGKRSFLYPKNELDFTSDLLLRHWAPTIGALTLPFKYRPQRGKFEKAFTIGISGGVSWRPNRINDFTISLLGFVSASSITFDKYNTDTAANITAPSERGAVTLGTSVMFQWEKLQIGFLYGFDMALDNEIAKWRYQGRPWLSVGIGINLFAPSEVKSAGNNK